MNFIFLGPPGSGKGTQAERLANKLNLFLFGMGDLMREEAAKKSPLGIKFQEIWDKKDGSLIPEALTDNFVKAKILEIPKEKDIIFDGYPRRVTQANKLNEMISADKIKVINIAVSDPSLIDRLSLRKVCKKCGKVFFQADKLNISQCDSCHGELIRRQEDDPVVIKKRLEVYNQETKPLIDYYQQKNNLININGESSIDEVEKEIWEKINE